MGRHHQQRTPEELRAPRKDIHISKSPKGWLPKKAAVVLLFLCLPRFVFFVGCCFTLSGMILTICASSDNVPYDNKAAGPCLLVFGVIFAFSYVMWKNFRRKPAEGSSTNTSGTDNPAYGSKNNMNGRKNSPQSIINIPAPKGSSAPAIQIQGPSVRPKKVQFKNNQNSNFLSTASDNSITASPVIDLKVKENTRRTRRTLDNLDEISTMVEVHAEPQPGTSGTSSNKNGSIYTIPNIINDGDDDDDDDF